MLCTPLAPGAPLGAVFPRRSSVAPQSRRRRAPSARSCHASALVRGADALRAVALGLVALPGRVLLGRAGLLAARGVLDSPPDPLWGAGHLDVVDAERAQRVDDRVDDRRGRGYRAR